MNKPTILLSLDMRDPEEGLPSYMRECDPPAPVYNMEELTDEVTYKTVALFTDGVYELANAYISLKNSLQDEHLSVFAERTIKECLDNVKNSLEDTIEGFLYEVLDNGVGRDYLYHFSVEVK